MNQSYGLYCHAPNHLPLRQALADAVLQELPSSLRSRPLIARKSASNWQCVRKWSPDFLAERVDGELKFRLGLKNQGASPPHWECDANYASSTVRDFVSWVRGESLSAFTDCPSEKWWAYAAYLHMSENPALCDLRCDVEWRSLFPSLPNNGESTFWLGSEQSQTGCHYDTYGINFVVQIFGRKKWILFPPTDSPFLYPTRIPLEESTVFSQINFQCPNFAHYPLLLQGHPQVVTLEPGDVLYVPRHWWHYVETVGEPISCAVNMWLDQPQLDGKARCKEALTQLACFSLANCAPDDTIQSQLHPIEKAAATSPTWFSELVDCISESSKLPTPILEPYCEHSGNDLLPWEIINAADIVDILPDSEKLPLSSGPSGISTKQIVSAFLHPDVIDLVYSKLFE